MPEEEEDEELPEEEEDEVPVHLFFDLGQRLRARDAVGGEAVLPLEVHNRGLGDAAVVAADRTGVQPELGQILLKLENSSLRVP